MTQVQRKSIARWTILAVLAACAGALVVGNGGRLAATPTPIEARVVEAKDASSCRPDARSPAWW